MFTHYNRHAVSRPSQAGGEGGRGHPRFATEYGPALLEVRNDAGMGAMLGVRQTPTLFINGRQLEGGLDAVIELEAQRDKYKPRPRIDSCRLALGMQQRADCPG